MASAPGYLSKGIRASEALRQPHSIDFELNGSVDGIAGHVSDATGGVVAGAVVTAWDLRGKPLSLGFTDEQGRFQLGVLPGPLRIRVEADNYSQVSQEARAPDQLVEVVLTPGSVIVGRVEATGTGVGIADVAVTALERGLGISQPHPVHTLADGSFEMKGLAAGGYDLIATAPGWRAGPRTVDLTIGELAQGIVLAANPATHLTASVTLDGVPCERGFISMRGEGVEAEELLNDGGATMMGLPPGRYFAVVSCTPNELDSVEGSLNEAREAVVSEEYVEVASVPSHRRWELTSPAPLQARKPTVMVGSILATIHGAAPSSIGLAVHMVAFESRRRIIGRLEGEQWLFQQVRLGEYEVFLERAPQIRQLVRLEHPGQVLQVALNAPLMATIGGRVFDELGIPVPDVWVRAYRIGSESGFDGRPVLTDYDGAFVLELLEGTYQLVSSGLGRHGNAPDVTTGSDNVELRLVPDLR